MWYNTDCMNNPKLDFDRFLSLVRNFPEEKREKFMQKVETTVAMGVRAMVLANLEKKDKEDFERVIEDGGDAKILEFGFAKIPNFDKHLTTLLDKVYAAAQGSFGQL